MTRTCLCLARRVGLLLCFTLLSSITVNAGGVREFDNAGNPMRWNPGNTTAWPDGVVRYHPDQGPLGQLSNAEARQLVAEAFAVWSGLYYHDVMESGRNGWKAETLATDSPEWQQTGSRWFSPFNSWFVPNLEFVTDSVILMPKIRDLPFGAELRFRHYMNAEGDDTAYDGGRLEYSTDGLTWFDALPSDSYSHTVSTQFGSPLAGQRVWSGLIDWEEVVVDLAPFWSPLGTDITFRWRFASDTSISEEGWYIDDVMVTAAGVDLAFAEGGLLPENVTSDNLGTRWRVEDGFSPVIFDSDGTILSEFFGGEESRHHVLGLSVIDTGIDGTCLTAGTPCEANDCPNQTCAANACANSGDPCITDLDCPPEPCFSPATCSVSGSPCTVAADCPAGETCVAEEIAEAGLLINGAFFDGIGPPDSPPDLPSRKALLGVLVHEIGHFLNLGHSIVNGDLASDDSVSTDAFLPSMFPFTAEDDESPASLHADDVAALRALYDDGNDPTTVSVSGAIQDPAFLYLQGAEVTIRDVFDPLTNAYSYISGGTYSPCRAGPATNACAQASGNPSRRGNYNALSVPTGVYTICSGQAPAGSSEDVQIPRLPGPEECLSTGESNNPAVDDPDDVLNQTFNVSVTSQNIVLSVHPGNPTLLPGGDDNEANDTAGTATPLVGLDSPGQQKTVAGVLAPGDVDFFSIASAAGEVRFDLDAFDAGLSGCSGSGQVCSSDSDCLPAQTCDGSVDSVIVVNGPLTVPFDDSVDPDSLVSGLDPAGIISAFPATVGISVHGNESQIAGQTADQATSGPYWLRFRVVADSDGDGFRDDSDNCPSVANPSQANLTADSFGNACDLDDDKDGLPDLDEVERWLTDPADDDSDGDFVFDGQEIERGSDPNLADAFGEYGPAKLLPPGTGAFLRALSVGDLDRDGDADLISSGSDTVTWHENLGGQVREFAPHQITSSGTGIGRAIPVDLDRDGKLDIATAHFANRIAWHRNTSTGTGATFAAEALVSNDITIAGRELAAADIDRDGWPDLVSLSEANGNLHWHENELGTGGTFTSHLISGTLNVPLAVDLADLDRNGWLDIIVASHLDDAVFWFPNSDTGFVAGPTPLVISRPESVLVMDVDGDGDQDVVAGSSTSAQVGWFENRLDESSTFASLQSISTLAGVANLDAGDFDRDGDDDLAVAVDSGAVAIFENSAGQFQQETLFSGANNRDVAFADLDDDGDLDLAVNSTAAPFWHENRLPHRNAVFDSGVEIDDAAFSAAAINVGDLDQDGDADLVTGGYQRPVVWYRNDLGASFVKQPDLPGSLPGISVREVLPVDIDHDGDLDIVVAAVGNAGLSWRRNDGGGTFTELPLANVGGARDVDVGDIDGDGLLDVIAPIATSESNPDGTLSWIRNLGGTFGAPVDIVAKAAVSATAVADFDGDGDLDVAFGAGDGLTWYSNDGLGVSFTADDIATSSGAVSHISAGDIDGDGDVDIAALGGGRVTWYGNTGAGSFDAGSIVDDLGSAGFGELRLADLDADGDLDLTSTQTNRNRVVWYRNTDGDGTFDGPWSFAAGLHGEAAIADFDRDGRRDVAFGDFRTAKVTWHRNQGGEYSVEMAPDNTLAVEPETGVAPFPLGSVFDARQGRGSVARLKLTHFGQPGDPSLGFDPVFLTVRLTRPVCQPSGQTCGGLATCPQGDTCEDVPLLPNEANELFDTFELWLDDGTDYFDPVAGSDLQISSTFDFLADGQVEFGELQSPALLSSVLLNPGEEKLYFLVAGVVDGTLEPTLPARFRVEASTSRLLNLATALEAVPAEPENSSTFSEVGEVREFVPLTVRQTIPGSVDDVSLSTPVVVTFDQPIDPNTATPSTIYLEEVATNLKVNPTVTPLSDLRTVVLRSSFDPALQPNTEYRIVVTNGVQNFIATGAEPLTVGFRTVSVSSANPIGSGSVGGSGNMDLAGTGLDGQQADEHSGTSVAVLESLDGDGVFEILVGAPDSDVPLRDNAGVVRLYRGGQSLQNQGPQPTATEFWGRRAEEQSGSDIIAVGDVGGSPEPDFLIGAPNADGGNGRVYLIFGTPAFATTPADHDLEQLITCSDPDLRGIIFQGSASERAGTAVGVSSNLDGNGVSALLIGAPNASPGGRTEAGQTYAVLPASGRFESLCDALGTNPPVELSAAGVDHDVLVFEGEAAFDHAGFSVSDWPDEINPFSTGGDLLIGAPGAASDTGADDAGRVYAIWGGQVLVDAATVGPVHLGRVANGLPDQIAGVMFIGTEPGDQIGAAVEGGVDVDGDGAYEVFIGANGAALGIAGSGPKSKVRTKKVAPVGSGPTDISPILDDDAPPIDDGFATTFFVASTDSGAGALTLAAPGDVNGDGRDDIVIGWPGASPAGGTDAGRAHVVYGGPQTLLFDLVQLDEVGVGLAGLVLEGASGDRLGLGLGGGGDVNGDGIDDALIGAPFETASALSEAGVTYVVSPVEPSEVQNVGFDKIGGVARLEWDPADRALAYHVYEFTLEAFMTELRSSASLKLLDGDSCVLTPGDADSDGRPDLEPPPGVLRLRMFLVTARNRIGESPLGPPTASPPRIHDGRCP